MSNSNSTQDSILNAAREFFARDGYNGTSMRKLAQAVGIKPASLYNHFPSKEDILWGIVRRATLQLETQQQEAFREESSATSKLLAFTRIHVEYHALNTQEATIANVYMYSLSSPRFEEIAAFRRRYEEMLQAILREGVENGEFDVPDIAITSYAILQMGIGVSYWFSPQGSRQVDELAGMYQQFSLAVATSERLAEALKS